MNFEDTKLPDYPPIRTAFEEAASAAKIEPKGYLQSAARRGQILSETVPSADPEQIAAAMLFLDRWFQEPSLMKRKLGDELPKACAWSQEWRNVETGSLRLKDATLELRQIVTASLIGSMEDVTKNNLQDWEADEAREELAAMDLMMAEAGDLQAPALEEKFRQTRTKVEQALKSGADDERPARPGFAPPPRF